MVWSKFFFVSKWKWLTFLNIKRMYNLKPVWPKMNELWPFFSFSPMLTIGPQEISYGIFKERLQSPINITNHWKLLTVASISFSSPSESWAVIYSPIFRAGTIPKTSVADRVKRKNTLYTSAYIAHFNQCCYLEYQKWVYKNALMLSKCMLIFQSYKLLND